MGAAKMGASVSLLLAVGLLLLLAPWWPLPALVVVLLVLSALVAAVSGFALVAAVAYRRRAGPPRAAVASCRSRARWQAGRWDTDPRHAYVANIGDETAYDVDVRTSDRVVGTAQRVPPFRADRLSVSSEPPCYVNFCVHERLQQPAINCADAAQRSIPDTDVHPGLWEVVVHVRWRSQDGLRFAETVRTG